ncbi:uncharacterized protein LOC135313250 [Phalacrocorax carbo]|uniref:uncharacterized protein LOC135313250 n=1 Tax=Phalacrocorax carbo TaxID=9209 RepID=UPI003119F0F1
MQKRQTQTLHFAQRTLANGRTARGGPVAPGATETPAENKARPCQEQGRLPSRSTPLSAPKRTKRSRQSWAAAGSLPALPLPSPRRSPGLPLSTAGLARPEERPGCSGPAPERGEADLCPKREADTPSRQPAPLREPPPLPEPRPPAGTDRICRRETQPPLPLPARPSAVTSLPATNSKRQACQTGDGAAVASVRAGGASLAPTAAPLRAAGGCSAPSRPARLTH